MPHGVDPPTDDLVRSPAMPWLGLDPAPPGAANPAPAAPGPNLRAVIIGGGLTGLVAAYRLTREPGVSVTLLEGKDRLGGAIWSQRRDGFLVEGGADSFITNKPWAVELCRELGLELIGTAEHPRKSFVLSRGRLAPVPDGFALMAPNRLGPLLSSPILSWKGKLRVLLDLVLPRRAESGDESLASFVRRRLGREALDRLVQPLVGGIYTADPNELSLAATLPQFLEMEREHGSLIRAALRKRRKGAAEEASGARYGLFATPVGGMGSLISALAQALPAGTIRAGTPVRRVAAGEPGGARWRVELLDGPPLEADAVLVATEPHAAARLADGFDEDLAAKLRGIPHASSAIVCFGYRREQVAHPLDGFGVVIPAIEGRRILAASFTSVKLPSRAPEGSVLMRIFVGGAMQPELFELDDEAIVRLAREEIEPLLGIKGGPTLVEVSRHPRAMPQYTLGHRDRVAAIRDREARHSGFVLAGNAYDGVGVPDCVRAGNLAAIRVRQLLGAPAGA